MTWYTYGKGWNKYKAKRTDYNGAVYHSKLEASQAMELDWRIKAGELKRWERQVRFDFWLVRERKRWYLTDKSPVGRPNIHLNTYYLDFVAHRTDKCKEYIEVKGMELQTWRQKWKYMCALYEDDPKIILKVVK